jgi:integrase
MTRPVNNQPIHTLSGRRRLPPKPSPYWRSVYLGLRVGWLRRPQDAAGRWFVRLALAGNDIRQTTLGAADDPPAKADGTAVLTYGQAVVAAQAWAAAVGADPDAIASPRRGRRRQASVSGLTVEDAMLTYAEAKRCLGQADRTSEVRTVLHLHMTLSFRALPLTALTPEVLNSWLAQLSGQVPPGKGGRLSQGRVDKVRGVLRAALHLAKVPEAIIHQGLSAAAMPRREAPATRAVGAIPTPDEVHRLIATTQATDADLALFMEVLALTGTRPSQLVRCRRNDLDALNGLLTIPASHKGRAGKAVRMVTFPIGGELAGRVARQLDQGSGLLFHTAKLVQDFTLVAPEQLAAAGVGDTWREVGRTHWNKYQWVRRVRASVRAAGLNPAITIYSLRHARIIRLIQGGMALREVAGLTDTSVVMIEHRYAKHIAATDATTARLRRLLEAEAGYSPNPPPPLLHRDPERFRRRLTR